MKNYCDPFEVGDIYGTAIDTATFVVTFYRYRNNVYQEIVKVNLKKNVFSLFYHYLTTYYSFISFIII
jgi:hypothetical protein